MKAVLLAAGLGTRLRPLTEQTPKPLVEIDGRPLLGWWLDLLEREGVDEVLINLHHLPEKVTDYLATYRGPIVVTMVYEPELLGSAGTLLANSSFFEREKSFFILYGDNLTNVRLGDLLEHNSRFPAELTVGLFHAENPRGCGIAELDGSEEGRIVSFVEKPESPRSDLASAGIFVARPDLFDRLDPKAGRPYDFGRHVMPNLVGRMNGLMLRGYLRDIGTFEGLEAGEREWKGLGEEGSESDRSGIR